MNNKKNVEPMPKPSGKRRGRPKGSKNKKRKIRKEDMVNSLFASASAVVDDDEHNDNLLNANDQDMFVLEDIYNEQIDAENTESIPAPASPDDINFDLELKKNCDDCVSESSCKTYKLCISNFLAWLFMKCVTLLDDCWTDALNDACFGLTCDVEKKSSKKGNLYYA